MLAKLLDAFTIPAGRLTEVEVGRALASTKLRSKHHRRQEINSRPRERVSPPFPTPYSPELQGANHTLRHGHTHRHADTHACKHTSANTHAHSLRFTPVSLLPTRRAKGRGADLLLLCPTSAPMFTFPMKLLFFFVVNFPGRCVYLFPKLSPVTKSNLRHWNNQ